MEHVLWRYYCRIFSHSFSIDFSYSYCYLNNYLHYLTDINFCFCFRLFYFLGSMIPNTTEPVFCKFKPLTNVTNIREFRSCSENTETDHITNMHRQQNNMRRENGGMEVLDKYTKIGNDNTQPITDSQRKTKISPGEVVKSRDYTVTENRDEYENQDKEKEIDTNNNNLNILENHQICH
jgi:hypothetical protein